MNNRLSLRGVEFSRLHDYLGVWAVEESHFNSAFHRVQQMDLVAHIRESQARVPAGNNQPARNSYDTIATTSGLAIAVMHLEGEMMKHSSSFAGTSTVELRQQIRDAARDPQVGGILLVIESPGGTVAGTSELAQDIARAAEAKPLWTFVEDLCASAAYWAASQSARIIANDRTALVGSIGTYRVVYDLSEQAKKEGIEVLTFKTGELKAAGVPGTPITKAQRAYFQGLVDQMQESFSAGVASGRGFSAERVNELATGGVWLADQALKEGLIDSIDSLDNVITQLAAEVAAYGEASAQRYAARSFAMSKPDTKASVANDKPDPAPAPGTGTAAPEKEAPEAPKEAPEAPEKPDADKPAEGDDTKPTPDGGGKDKPSDEPTSEAGDKASEGTDLGGGLMGQLAAAHERIGELKATMASMTEAAKASADQIKQLQACVDSMRGEENPAVSKDTKPDPGKKDQARGASVSAESIVIRGR